MLMGIRTVPEFQDLQISTMHIFILIIKFHFIHQKGKGKRTQTFPYCFAKIQFLLDGEVLS